MIANRFPQRLMSVLVFVSLVSVTSAGSIVRFVTAVGDFEVELYNDITPITVANFLNYVNDGDYVDSIVHRSVPNFVIQGGGYYSDLSPVPANPPIINESGVSNLRGTIAMARTSDPDSATNQWFINLGDNSFLDTQSGGFAVFGEVVVPGMSIVDQIAALDRIDAGSPFDDLPVFDDSLAITPSNLVTIESVTVVPEPSSGLLLFGSLGYCWAVWSWSSSSSLRPMLTM